MKAEKTIKLDVREDIKNGREPFGKIMSALNGLQEGQSLSLLAPFEPRPLFGVLAARGFSHVSTPLDNGDFEVLFAPVGLTEPPASSLAAAKGSAYQEVDTRGLPPPDPMVKILEALSQLPPHTELLAITDRRPMHLYEQLSGRGFVGTTEERPDGGYLTRIQRA